MVAPTPAQGSELGTGAVIEKLFKVLFDPRFYL